MENKTKFNRASKIFFLGLIILVFSIALVSAAEWDNVKRYDEETKTVTIKNTFGLPLIGSNIATAKLDTPQIYYVEVGYGKVAQFTINPYVDYGNMLENIELYNVQDGKAISRQIDVKYLNNNKWIDWDKNAYVSKEVIVGLFTNVQNGDNIEWIPTIAGVRVSEWAVWIGGNIMLYDNFNDNLLNTVLWTNASTTTGARSFAIVVEKGGELVVYANGTNNGFGDNQQDSNAYVETDTLYINYLRWTVSSLTVTISGGAPTSTASVKINNIIITDKKAGDSGTYDDYATGTWEVNSTNNTYHQISKNGAVLRTLTNDFSGGKVRFTSSHVLFAAGETTVATQIIDNVYLNKGFLNASKITPLNESSTIEDYVLLNVSLSPTNMTLINNTFNVWYSNNTLLTSQTLGVTGTTQNFSVYNLTNIPLDTFLWDTNTCITLQNGTHQCVNSGDNFTFSIVPFLTNNIYYNPTASETASETFYTNITSNGTAIASGELIYDGTAYTSTVANTAGNNYNLSNTIDISTTPENKSFFWNFSLAGTEYSTDATNQTVNLTNLTICSTTIPYINFTFKDEETSSTMNATIDTSTWEYWLGSGTVTKTMLFSNTSVNDYYPFCLNGSNETLHNTRSVQFSSPGYPQRKYDAVGDLTSTPLNKTLWLLSSADGIYSSIQVVDQNVDPVIGAGVRVERQFTGVWTIVGQEITDSAGLVTFWVNPDYNHRYTFTSDDCDGSIITIRPTQTLYTKQLSCTGNVTVPTYISSYEGINYSFSPKPGYFLAENSFLPFTFNITANLSNLVSYSINITDAAMTELNASIGTTATGGNLTIYVNTTGNTKLYGYYYMDVGNGSFLMDPAIWAIRDIEAGRGSLLTGIRNLLASEVSVEDNYNSLFFMYFIFFVAIAAFTYKSGLELSQPGISLFIIFFFVLIISMMGFLTIDFAPSAFINEYGIALIIFLLTGGYTLGQWAKT